MSFKLIRVALMALLTCLGISVHAVEYHGFVKDPYYLVKGGKVVSPKDFAADPLKYMRSNVAYLALRDHASQVVGKPMSDQAFRQLLVSDDVKLVDCVGRKETQGVTDSGQIGQHERDCYKDEKIMQVKVLGGWMDLLSTGCYNPVYGVRPLVPITPAPVAGICGENAQHYAAGTIRFPSTLDPAFCKAGSLDKAPDFGEGRWLCQGDNGGPSQQCVATVAPDPVKVFVAPETEEVCELVAVHLGASNIPQTTAVLSGRLNDTCTGTQWLPGLQVSSGGGTGQTFGFKEVCRTVIKKK